MTDTLNANDAEGDEILDRLAGLSPVVRDPEGKPYGSRLLPQHATKICSSGITAEVAEERGYVSADTKAQLEREGFAPAQRRPPALVIPIFDVLGQRAGGQLRPDEPRMIAGRPAKYETRSGQRMLLDVPPRVRSRLGDPSVPLVVTEGPLKADAAVSAGLACIALLGVWNWRGANKHAGTVMLPDWENVALNGRRVVIAFDSDAMLKENVHEAMRRLAGALGRRGAEVGYVYLPPTAIGEKMGLDDWLAITGNGAEKFWSLVTNELRRPIDDDAEPEDTFEDVDPEDGCDVLDDLVAFLTRYVAFPQPGQAEAVALWGLHTHAIAAFESTPRLAVLSPEKQSGKTRVLEVLHLVCRNATHNPNMTASYLFHVVDLRCPTLLVDEVDTIFGHKDKSHDDLRGVINAGHRRGATVGRMVGEGANMAPYDFPVFCPVALAGIGKIPDTILDRSVLVAMRRRAPGDEVEQFRQRWVAAEGAWLYRRCAAWAYRNLDDLSLAEPAMPDGIVDRAADVWEPLVAIADQAGAGWPERARSIAVTLNAAREEEDASLGVKLLADVRTIFEESGLDRVPSADLAEKLAKMEEAPWGDLWGKALDSRGLARRLRAYHVHPKVIRVGDKTHRGYERGDFGDAWTRYLPSLSGTVTTVTTVTGPPEAVTTSQDVTAGEAMTCGVTSVTSVTPPGGPGAGVTEAVTDEGPVTDNGPQRMVFDLPRRGVAR
jgi:hypothetical protein